MKRLMCRLAEYFLALCEDDIEGSLPNWVRRHLKTCSRCQVQALHYRRTHQALRQYARLLPSSPPAGWQPLQVSTAVKQRTFPLQVALASMTGVVAVVIGLSLWLRGTAPVDHVGKPLQTAPQLAQRETQPVAPSQIRKPAAPASEDVKAKPSQLDKPAPPAQARPEKAPHRTPAPAHQPPRRIVVAAQPTPQPVGTSHEEAVGTASSEPLVPVQPVVSEAHPVASTPVPETYVMQAAYPATAGAVE